MSSELNGFIVRGRRDKDNPYFVAARNAAQDERLSWEARGVLFYLLSKPDDWQVRTKDLYRPGAGRDKMAAILKELQQAGYLVRQQIHGKRGRITWVSAIYDQPQTEPPPSTDLPYTVKPHFWQPIEREEVPFGSKNDTLTEPTQPPPSTDLPLTVKASIYIKDTELDISPLPDGKGGRDDKSPDTQPPPNQTQEPVLPIGKSPPISVTKMNPMKDAIVAAFGWNPKKMTTNAWGMVQKAAYELCAIDFSPGDVAAFFKWMKDDMGWKGVKPTALPLHVNTWMTEKGATGDRLPAAMRTATEAKWDE